MGSGPGVVLVDSGGVALTVSDTPQFAMPFTVVAAWGLAATLVDAGGLPVVLYNPDGTVWTDGPDVTAPTITSANSGNNVEGVVLAHALTANESVTWSIIGGADQAQFEISGSTLRWASNGVQDFEAPADAGANNVYVVDVRATDTATNTADQTITITVTDVATDAPAAPDLTWNSLETDNEPDFLLDLPRGWGDYRDAVAGDHAIVERSLQSGGAWTEYIDRTLSAGDISDDTLTVTGVGSIANELYFFRAYLTRGNAASPTSANEAVTINVAGGDSLLLEIGDDLLLETGDRILLEA